MDFGPRPAPAQIRERVAGHARTSSDASIELAWDLGAIRAEELYRGWQTAGGESFTSFYDYVAHDLAVHVSHRQVAALCDIGVYLGPVRATIDAAVAAGRIGIHRLSRLGALVRRQELTVDDVVDLLTENRIAGEETLPHFRHGPTDHVLLTFPTSIGEDLRRRLTYFALARGVASLEEAFAVLVTQSGDVSLPPTFARYAELIEVGDFRCRLCGKFPLDPVEVILSSATLLCRTPCWTVIVEPEQAKYALRWRRPSCPPTLTGRVKQRE